jgi:flavin-binding protein dodecin
VPNLINSQKIALIGSKSAELAAALAIESSELEFSDIALFLVSAKEGIVSADLAKWRTARELYIPSLVVICDLLTSEIDFEDMTAIAGKMLDPVANPYLVLHSDEGAPAALIDLESLEISDYSTGSKVMRPAEPEHVELVAEFRTEYLEDLEDAGEDAFAAGLLFPALPWVEGTRIGIDQILEYLKKVPVSS